MFGFGFSFFELDFLVIFLFWGGGYYKCIFLVGYFFNVVFMWLEEILEFLDGEVVVWKGLYWWLFSDLVVFLDIL